MPYYAVARQSTFDRRWWMNCGVCWSKGGRRWKKEREWVRTRDVNLGFTVSLWYIQVGREFLFFDARVIFTNWKRIIRFRRDIWGAYNAQRTVQTRRKWADKRIKCKDVSSLVWWARDLYSMRCDFILHGRAKELRDFSNNVASMHAREVIELLLHNKLWAP
jgi:hypothetical protein